MNFELPFAELRLTEGFSNIQTNWCSVMEGRARRVTLARAQDGDHKRSLPQGIRPDFKRPQGNRGRTLSSNYFSLESLLILLCLTASLLILPLILPPLPPPPLLLLLLPIGILLVLLVLAFMPSDVRDLASSYL